MYNVYVIELAKAVMEIAGFRNANPDYNPEKPCVYVGQTARTAEERFRQHCAGQRANRFVKKYGKRLRPKLFERFNPIQTRS